MPSDTNVRRQRTRPGRWFQPAHWLPVLLAFGAPCALPAPADAALPDTLAPRMPFPHIITQTFDHEFVAPGVERGVYRLQTARGPLVVTVVGVDPREPTVHLATVLAHDRIVSTGETVSSMAARTGAVAGINADYFDIGNTNAPLGVVVHDGTLERSPSARPALTVARDGSVRFETYRFAGSAVAADGTSIGITAVNAWPPAGGAALLTPAYGVSPSPSPSIVTAELSPVAAPGAGGALNGTYRVTQIDRGTAPAGDGFALGFGAAAQSTDALPAPGDLLDIRLDTDPPLADVLDAVGGGPLLLADGLPVDDRLSPGFATRALRIPVSAVARFPDGTLALIVIDGRRPQISIGVDREELIALLRGMGATDALQLDSGGSATLVARNLGTPTAALQNDPSDGVERPVADALLVYSTAPAGPPARLVIRPSRIQALPGTAVQLRARIVDAAGHDLGAASGPWETAPGLGVRIDASGVLHVGDALVDETIAVTRNGVQAALPISVVAAVARLTISPERPNPEPDGEIALHVRALDARGRTVQIGDAVRWSARHGSIDPDGTYHAQRSDDSVTAAVGATKVSVEIRVGRHDERLDFAARRASLRFTTVPVDGPGDASVDPAGSVRIAYDFRGDERAAYANAGIALGEPLALTCTIDGDGNGAGVRAAFTDRYGERTALTLAKRVDWTGPQRATVRIPAALAPPIVLQSLYVIGSLGPAPVKSAGTIGIRDCSVADPGSVPSAP